MMRRMFALPEEDVDFLESIGQKWETIADGRFNWLIIYDYPLPTGYNHQNVNVAFRIDHGYPVSQIDMAYFNPPLKLVSGQVIGASNAVQQIEGKGWQRWSRHRTGHNPWRPGVDGISTHLLLMDFWINRELNKLK